MRTLADKVLLAHQRSVPLVAITTADPRSTLRSVTQRLRKDSDSSAMVAVEWDLVQGLRGVTPEGREWEEGCKGSGSQDETGFPRPDPTVNDPVAFLGLIRGLPADSVAFFHSAHRFLLDTPEFTGVSQGIANLRDLFKENNRTLILLCPDIQLPAELQDDVMVFDEPLPTREELEGIVDRVHRWAGVEGRPLPVNDGVRAAAADYVTGLSAFAAEQALALALTQEGVNLQLLRELRRRSIEQTPGLTIYKGDERYEDVGGVEYAKEFFGRILGSSHRPRAIVYVDEIEKALAGAGGAASDSSGVSQDILGTLLSFMEDSRVNGTICFGPPGCSKSLIAKATGNQGNIDTIQFDIGALKGSFVGQSERNIRRALKVIDAASAGRSYWIATCNAVKPLPGPLLRRFTHGILFFDLPEGQERKAIWQVHLRHYALTGDRGMDLPDDRDWTGADVRNCCELARDFNITPREASRYILPVAVSNPELVAELRREAQGHYKSAATGEIYQRSTSPSLPPAPLRPPPREPRAPWLET